jgi:sirohydrochlorin ferrochelatase
MLALIPRAALASSREEAPDPEAPIGGRPRVPRLVKSRVTEQLARYAGVSIAWTEAIGEPPVGLIIHMIVFD